VGGKQYTTYIDSAGHGTTIEGANGAAAIVKDILGVSKIILDKDPEDFNFIKAGADLFLLNDRSDTVLKKLSFLIGSQKIEDAALALASELRKTETERELVRKEAEKQKQFLENKAPIVEEIKFLLESYKTVKQTLDMLTVTLTQIQKFQVSKDRYNSTLQLWEDLKEQKTFVEELRNLQEHYSKFQSLSKKHKDLQESIESLQAHLLLAKVKLDELEEEQKKNPICPTCNRPL
jgi:DNA repair exonuclease SbcCD ATPase subunit